MFIAHAPVGYLLGTGFVKAWTRMPLSARMTIAACIAGSLAPDLDLVYFYAIDHRHTHHHKYFTHWPIVWMLLLACALAWHAASRTSRAATALALFAFCALIHIVMDTVVGDIWWLAPFVDRPYVLFHVEARFSPWWLNFLLHWSFALELALLAWAIARYRRRASQGM